MKISGLEKGVLALTMAFLLLSVGYFLVQQTGSEPYTVSAQTAWAWETGAAEQEQGQEEEREQGQTAAVTTEKININTATQAQLEALPGIGQTRAAAIVADRETNGPYRLPEDIIRVSGIGEGILENILDYITVE